MVLLPKKETAANKVFIKLWQEFSLPALNYFFAFAVN
jgi:hypothetical protein